MSELKYCLFSNKCSSKYKCCHYCKKVCDESCKDNTSTCKYLCEQPKLFEQHYTVNETRIKVKNEPKKVKQIIKPFKAPKINCAKKKKHKLI